MGGQACVFYGAAEFSRDTDFAILANPPNLARLRRALAELQAEVITVPPFELRHLRRGHAVHFRCHHPQAEGLRIDVMSKLRGTAPFVKLWRRRASLGLPDGIVCELLSLPDLVQTKKPSVTKTGLCCAGWLRGIISSIALPPRAIKSGFGFGS
jgi:hypothetical protein